MIKIPAITFLMMCLFFFLYSEAEQLPFVVIIPSYNNERWCEKNLHSALEQQYDNYKIIYIDDCSADNTGRLVTEIANTHTNKGKLTVLTNTSRCGALANLYNVIHSCPDDAIIVTLDGDDWFSHEHVLARLNQEYADSNVWMTYGSYMSWPQNARDLWIHPLPEAVIANHSYRSYQWVTTHLRTFYARLFKMVKKEDLLHNNEFFSMTWDLAFMFPMLEMSGHHSRYIHDVLYVYNRINPLGDRNSNRTLQMSFEHSIRSKVPYQPIERLFEA